MPSARSLLGSNSFLCPRFRTSILHRAVLAKDIVPGKSLFQQVRGMTTSLQRPLKVVAKPVPVNWMSKVFDNHTGALPGCETAQISQAHLGDNDVYVVLVSTAISIGPICRLRSNSTVSLKC
jgi:hypothetical protein